ncbi:MAG: hypothetical protein AB7P23_02760 [Amphiplicatus sp.]
MRGARMIGAFVAAAAVAYVAAVVFFTQQVIAKQAAVGARYTLSQQAETYLANFTGLGLYGAVLTTGLLIGFLVGALARRFVRPLARIAYPLAGAAAVWTAITLIETRLGGGAGVIGGARDALGLALQCGAGALGGVVFAALRPHS